MSVHMYKITHIPSIAFLETISDAHTVTINTNTGLFEMTVGVLTTCHTQYT